MSSPESDPGVENSDVAKSEDWNSLLFSFDTNPRGLRTEVFPQLKRREKAAGDKAVTRIQRESGLGTAPLWTSRLCCYQFFSRPHGTCGSIGPASVAHFVAWELRRSEFDAKKCRSSRTILSDPHHPLHNFSKEKYIIFRLVCSIT